MQSSSDVLVEANKQLGITKDKIIFVYSCPKVGSTSLVSSLRIFCIGEYDIFHLHDELMLAKLAGISDVSINDIIKYNKDIGKKVFVINVYRNPVERKISVFFEKLCTVHFNAPVHIVEQYNIQKIIDRFNRVFPHIGNGDHLLDVYRTPIPATFNHTNKYLYFVHDSITYIILRLSDSSLWGDVLTNIFKTKISIL